MVVVDRVGSAGVMVVVVCCDDGGKCGGCGWYRIGVVVGVLGVD